MKTVELTLTENDQGFLESQVVKGRFESGTIIRFSSYRFADGDERIFLHYGDLEEGTEHFDAPAKYSVLTIGQRTLIISSIGMQLVYHHMLGEKLFVVDTLYSET